jgi:hypothetical protein
VLLEPQCNILAHPYVKALGRVLQNVNLVVPPLKGCRVAAASTLPFTVSPPARDCKSTVKTGEVAVLLSACAIHAGNSAATKHRPVLIFRMLIQAFIMLSLRLQPTPKRGPGARTFLSNAARNWH